MGENISEGITKDFEEYFETLFKVYFIPLKLHARSFIQDDAVAGDLVQDVFLHIWENRQLFDFTGSVRNYLYKSVRNKCLNHLNHKVIENKYKEFNTLRIRQLELYTDDFIDKHVGVLLEEELQKKLDAAITKLPPRCKKTYLLSREEGLSVKEIAAKMNISEKAVERNMTRALKVIRIALKDYFIFLALINQILK